MGLHADFSDQKAGRAPVSPGPLASIPAHLPANIRLRIQRLTDASAGPNRHWRWLGSKMQANGYPQISYRDAETGKRVTRNVHRILMELREGRRLDRSEIVLHCRGVRSDDVNPAGLRIGSQVQNAGDAKLDGRCSRRLTPSEVLLVDGLLRRGVNAATIATRFDISPVCVRRIYRGQSHAKLTGRVRTRGISGRPRKRILVAPEPIVDIPPRRNGRPIVSRRVLAGGEAHAGAAA